MAGSLAHSPADVIRWLLVQLGVGTDPTLATLGAWPVYDDSEPDQPDDVLTVYDTAPRVHGRTHPDGETQQHYGVQVRVRAATKTQAWAKANGVATAFDNQYQDVVRVGSVDYEVHAVHHGGVIRLGKTVPTSKRSVYTVNALAAIKQL